MGRLQSHSTGLKMKNTIIFDLDGTLAIIEKGE